VDQTLRSVRHVTQAFSLPYRYFAFPYKNRGITPAFYERTRDEVDLFFTTSGWGNRMNRDKVSIGWGWTTNPTRSRRSSAGGDPIP